MKKTILEVYALAVCFVTLTCFVIVAGIASYSLVAVIKPEFTLNSWQYSMHQTNDAFWSGNGRPTPFAMPDDRKAEKSERPSEAELTKRREESYRRAIANEQRDGSQSLVKCLIIILIDASVFWLHWVIGRRARSAT